jgi:hypothetical protein
MAKDIYDCEVVRPDGSLVGVRTADVLAMLDLSERIENSTELMKLGGPEKSWAKAINGFLDMFDAPNNISELWVWRRFSWAFGRMATWDANDQLTALVVATQQLAVLSVEWHNRSVLSWFVRRRLEESINRAQVKLFSLLGVIAHNLKQWPDSDGFEKFSAGR